MTNPWGLCESHARVMTALAEHGCTDAVAREVRMSPTYVNGLISRLVLRMGCRNRCQAAVKWDRWHQLAKLAPAAPVDDLEEINFAFILRLKAHTGRQPCTRSA